MTGFREVRSPLFRSTITELRVDGLALATTAFEPRLNDRTSDLGVVAGMEVVDVAERPGGTIVHQVAHPHRLREFQLGQTVEGIVDQDHRRSLSRLHSAAHLLYFGFVAYYGPVVPLNRQVAASAASIDLDYPDVDQVEAEILQEWVRAVVVDDLLISVAGHRGRHYWHVDGVGTIACSGLHPCTTGQLGSIDVAVVGTPGGQLRLQARASGGGSGTGRRGDRSQLKESTR